MPKPLQPVQKDTAEWHILPHGNMRVPAIIHADETIVHGLDQATLRQLCNVASLPGIVGAAHAMPDAHSGYGFPIGGVAAFDPEDGGVVSAGGVGFDIACGVRSLVTGLTPDDVLSRQQHIADALYAAIPAGVGKDGQISLSNTQMEDMLRNGARWAVQQGYGTQADLDRTEDNGRMPGAQPDTVSPEAKKRFTSQIGSLGSGNHYMELQQVDTVYDQTAAEAFGIRQDDIILSIHCGSRGLGHQIGTDYLDRMAKQAPHFGIKLPVKELACAPILSELGSQYLGAMRAGVNAALANRQLLTHIARETLGGIFSHARLRMIYDVSHNTCKEEVFTENTHRKGRQRKVFVHRKGATRAFGPDHPDLPHFCRTVGQPVLIGGSMGTHSWILAGTHGANKAFNSANHGAGRVLSRTAARKMHKGSDLLNSLARKGIYIRSSDMRGIAEEAPQAYKDVNHVIQSVKPWPVWQPKLPD